MKAVAPFLALTVAALVAAGCSGGSNTSVIPGGPNAAAPASQSAMNAALAKAVSPNHGGDCDNDRGGGEGNGGDCNGGIVVLADLTYTATTGEFSISGCTDATPPPTPSPYTAPSSGPLYVANPVTIVPACIKATASPSPTPTPTPDKGTPTPSPTPTPDKGTPTPSPTPGVSAPNHRHRGSSGGGTVNASSTLYIVGIPVHGGDGDVVTANHGHGNGNGHGHGHGNGYGCHGDGDGHGGGQGNGYACGGVIIAGPTAITTDPWTFTPAYPAFQVRGGDSYVFFLVATTSSSPSPSPTPTPTPTPTAAPTGPITGFFHPIVPLTFDGTNFTVASSFTSCSQWWDETPYVATATGALTLASSPSVTPTCAPSPPPWAESWYPQPVYIVGAQLPNSDGKGIHSRHPRDWGLAFPATAIAGPVDPSTTPWTFAPIVPGMNLTAGDGYVFFVASQVGDDGGGGGDHAHR